MADLIVKTGSPLPGAIDDHFTDLVALMDIQSQGENGGNKNTTKAKLSQQPVLDGYFQGIFSACPNEFILLGL